MNDLITKKSVKNLLINLHIDNISINDKNVLDFINELPTIDTEVSFGEWIEVNEHIWEKDDQGEPDECAWFYDYHNGVTCLTCGKRYCVHCTPNWRETKCEKITYKCSKCGAHKLEKTNFCPDCGVNMRKGNKNET